MWRITLLAILVVSAGCTERQPESAKTVAAFEVPLPSEQERNEFLAILRREAATEGLHVDAASSAELERTAKAIPAATMTIDAAVWRGPKDDALEASIMDQQDHIGQTWIMFSKGEDPELARRFRERVMRKIVERWPRTLTLPIMPTGAIPLPGDLRRTPHGYEVDPDKASSYGLRTAPRRKSG